MLLLSEIEESVREQRTWLQNSTSGFQRTKLHQFHLTKNYITIITGIRRCGKSTLMHQFINQIGDDFGYFNFENPSVFGFDVHDFSKLEQALGDPSYYFFDEIQNIENWEIFIRKLHDRGKTICVTGSNASMLSKELGTRLTGRHIQQELFPFDFIEFCGASKKSLNQESLSLYLENGGFPSLTTDFQITYLHQLFSDILYRDIVARYGVRNVKTFHGLALYLISNVGKEYSLNGLKKMFDIGSANSVGDYISWLENSYLLFTLPKFSWSTKAMSVNQKKVYTIDTGFARANSLSFSEDKGRLFENLIYLHLRRSRKELFYFREKGECDFIVKSQNEFQAIQACYELTPDNLNREIKGVLEAMNFFQLSEGFIITMKQNEVFQQGDKVIYAISADKWMESWGKE